MLTPKLKEFASEWEGEKGKIIKVDDFPRHDYSHEKPLLQFLDDMEQDIGFD